LRRTEIIGLQGIVRHILTKHPDVERSIEEILRLIKYYQFSAKHGETCQALWKERKKR
jgi:alkyl hydroperoxide reductase subunit AhpC